MLGGAPSRVLFARQQALAVGLFGSLLTNELAVPLSKHPLCLQVVRRHGMVGLLHAATPAATNKCSGEASAQGGLLTAVSFAIRRMCRSVWLEETGVLGEEIGAVLGAVVDPEISEICTTVVEQPLGVRHSLHAV